MHHVSLWISTAAKGFSPVVNSINQFFMAPGRLDILEFYEFVEYLIYFRPTNIQLCKTI